MSQTEPWTIGRLLRWTTDYLRQHGAETPRLDAEVLLAECRKCQRIELYTTFDELAAESLRGAYRELVRRRAAGTPVAYLVGHREFFALDFRVTPAVLIPRPETEFILLTLGDLVPGQDGRDRPLQIADVGTGSGVLAICAARQLPSARITALDISPEALEVARGNAALHTVAERIEFLRSDLLEAIPAEPRFDFILSNPPYVSSAEFAELAREVKDHEPRVALLAGDTGQEVIARLIPQSAERLQGGGWLICEISPMLEQAVHQLIQADGRFEIPSTVKDLARLARVVKARRRAGRRGLAETAQ